MLWRSLILSLRASPALYAAPILAGLEFGVVLIEGQWRSEWRWVVDWAGAGVFLAGPMAGGLTAWKAQAVRRAPGEAAQVVGTPLRLFAFTAGGVLGWAALVHAAVVAIMIADGYSSGLTGWPHPEIIVLHWSLLAACVATGYIAGQLTMSRLLAPITSVALLTFMVQASNGALPTLWVEVAGATAPLAGLQYRPEVVVGQLVLFWALVLVAVGATKGNGRSLFRNLTLGVGVFAVIVGAAGLASAEQNRFSVVPTEQLGQRCFGASPKVCVLGDTIDFGPELRQVFAAFEAAAGSDSTLPSTYIQVMGTEGPSDQHRQFVLDPGVIEQGEVRPEGLARYIVWNRKCLLDDRPPPGRAVDLVADLEMVLLDRLADGASRGDSRLLAAFKSKPAADQDAWIAQMLAATNECAYGEMPEWLTTP